MATGEATHDLRGKRSVSDQLADRLLRWEEEYEQGRDVPPEEPCVDCPELAPALAERIALLKRASWLDRAPGCSESDRSGAGPDAAQGEKPRILAGRYFLDRVIGEGGAGQVWQGFDRQLGRLVAIKIPRPGTRTAQEQGERFTSEAQRVAQLRHPGIVSVHDMGRDVEGCFIVSDLVNGTDLRRLLLPGPMPLLAALRIAAEVAEALHHAHQQGFIHRDVKPGNILVDRSGRAFVTDFGIAVTAEEMQHREGSRCGTPAYMSPEQISPASSPLDHRTDVYSLGVVLYELLTGEHPAEVCAAAALRERIGHGTPRPLRAIKPDVPREAERICLKCLANRPEQRYQTARELAKDLHRLLARLQRRRSSLSLALTAATALLAAYNIYTLHQHRDDPRNWPRPQNDIHMLRGVKKLYEHRDYHGALLLFEHAEMVRPSALLYYLKGDSYLGLHEYGKALDCSKNALALYPDYPPAYNLQARVYEKRGQPQRAREYWLLARKHANAEADEGIQRTEAQSPPE
jgi:serine/threonine protein kinase